MKILHVGGERSDAQAVATALRGIAGNVTVSWTFRLDHVARWIDQNADLTALVVDAQVDRTGWRPVLKQVRGLTSKPLVVVLMPDGTGPQFESLELEADEYLTKNQSLFHDLPIVVGRAIDRARVHQQSTQTLNSVDENRECQSQLQALVELERAARADLEQKLAHARAELQEAQERHRSATTAATEQLAKHQAQYQIGMARAAATWEMVDEQLREAAIEVERGRRDQASAAAIVDRLSRREAELTSLLADSTAIRLRLERRLADSETALEAFNARAVHEQRAAAEQLADRRHLETQIAREIERRNRIEEALAQLVSERDSAEKRHASAMADAAEQSRSLDAAVRLAQQSVESQAADIERLTQRETDLTSMLADATTSHNNLERRLAATEAAFQDASARATRERLAAAKKAAEREAELDGQIQQERATCATLERSVADADAALHDAQQRHDAVLTASAQELTDRQAQFDHELTQTATARDNLAQRLSEAEVALDQLRRDHADLTSQIADVQTDRENLARQLVEAATAIGDAADREKELEDKLADRQAQFDHQLTQTAQREADLTSQIADVEADRDNLADQLVEAATAIGDAADREKELEDKLADRQAQFDHQLTQTAQREADLTSQIADVQADRDNLAHQLAEAATAIEHADEREKKLEEELAHRQAQFDCELTQTAAGRDSLAQRLIDAEVVLDQARRDREAAAGDVERLTQREAELTSQLADVQAARDAFERQVADAVNAMADAEERGAHERAAAADRQADLEARLTQTLDTRDTLERTLTETRSAALEAEGSFHAEIDTLRARSLEQASQFEARLADERLEYEIRLAEMQGCNRDLILEREALQQSLARTEEQLRSLDSEHRETCERLERARTAADADIVRLTAECRETERALETARHDFQDTLDRQKILEGEADRVPQLVQQLDESRAESERVFQQAQLAMFRCSRDGVLTQANRAWTALVRHKIDELRGVDFAADVFESPNDLSWLIEHCLSTRTKESIETTLRRKDGGRLFVRLSACATASNVIEIVAEDLTRIRVLQDRLGQAGRMEAVGRLASETALTCCKMLNDVQQHAQQWLRDVGGNAASRQEGEMLLDELTRVTGYLQQLVAYGDKESRTPALVDLNTVMRDLAPVLKHVAGDDVEVRLPAASAPLNVDVDTERVERLLVNLAAYGRERMQSGGRLTIEVGTIIVDRQFVAKYPNVRPGPHALITVTEIKRAARAHGLLQLRGGSTAHTSKGTLLQKPGVDLGTVQGLVGECGGHLWMRVQPLGDIVAKIRLPLLTSYDQTHAPALVARGDRGRTITRWFQH